MNFRNISRDSSGFSNLKKSEQNIKPLCELCAKQFTHCRLKQSVEEIESTYDLRAPIVTCNWFKFPLVFQKATGLQEPLFNTIRVGKAWSERLKKSDRVYLVTNKDEMICEADVHEVFLLGFDEALANHAHRNHLLIEQELTQEVAREQMRKTLRNVYGSMVVNNASQLSVIYLKPVQKV